MLLMGSIGFLNSPGAAPEPEEATAEDLQQYVGVVDEMRHRWTGLDAECDPDMVFALLYLITTAKVGDLVAADHFADNGFLVDWDEDFAGRYFAAYDAHHDGDPATAAPTPWRTAFEHADSGKGTVSQDTLLGINAHVNYDLAFSAYDMGLPQNDGKDEFDRVNDAFWNVPIPLADEMGARYDPGSARSSEELGPADYASIELLISWRENAWSNAVLLAEAPDPIARAVVAEKIQAEADAVAAGILLTADGSDTSQARQAYCHSSGHPPLAPELGGEGYGGDWVAVDDIWMCTPEGRSIRVNEHSHRAHENRGATHGRC